MLRRYRFPILLALILLLAIYLFGFRWRGIDKVIRRHDSFIEAIEEKDWGKCAKLVAPAYRDRWGFERSDILLTLEDVGRQFFIVLDLDWKTAETKWEGSTVSISGHGTFTGKGSPIASAIEARSKRYSSEPFTFFWKKQSFLPWDWKLVKIEHPRIEIPNGYRPGDLGSAVSGGF